MFDSSKDYKVPVPARVGSGEMLHVRWPNDQEWYTRARSKKLIQRKLGRGRTETVPTPPGEHDLKLYEAISLNGSQPISPGEAQMLLDALGTCTVTDVKIEDNEAVVLMQIVSGEVIHKLKVPTADQIITYRRAAYRLIELQHNQQEIRLNPQPGAELWDSCGGHSGDYVNGVPGIHKDVAIKGVIEYIDANVGPRLDENF